MTQYQRITGKVFGGNATATGNDPQIAQFGSALANTFVGTTDPETIQSLPAWGQGWIGAVTPDTQFPPLPEMTGAMKVLSHQICGILQQGVSTWDNGTIYYTGNFVSLNGKLYISQVDENQGNNPEADTTNWKEFTSGGGSGFNLFDTKISDHILTGDEAKGWALQGTYVSKALYPDFYNKCLEEYQNDSNINSYLSSNINYVGTITNNQGILSGFTRTDYAKTNIPMTPDSNVWEINLEITTGSDISTKQIVFGGSDDNIRSFHIGIQDTYWNIDIGSGASWIATTVTNQIVAQANTKYLLKATFDGASYVLNGSVDNGSTWVEFANYESTTPIANMVETKLGVGRDNGSPFYGLINLNRCNITINNVLFWQGVNSIEQNPNGHKFYPISQKTEIDEIYNQYGIADFYGIDEENERIFLPRNKYFQQLTVDVSNVNEMMEAGLPNIEGKVGGLCPNGGTAQGAFTRFTNVGNQGHGTNSYPVYQADFDASLSNPIYGNSSTVQPPSSLKLLYYCVGNTLINESEIDAGALVSQMEQKANIFLDNVLPSSDFRNQVASWIIPDYSSQIILEFGMSEETYIAPTKGWFSYGFLMMGNNTGYIKVNDIQVIKNRPAGGSLYDFVSGIIPVDKNDEIKCYSNATNQEHRFFAFFPMKGAN